jgi:hypothetical protein
MSNNCRPTLPALLALLLSGCAMTETTTTIRVQPGSPTERIRLVRPDASALSAVWRQEGSSVVGQLSFNDVCDTEAVQVNRRTQLTDTHPNRRYATGAYIAGAVLSVAAVALFANAQGKSESVTCGSGGSAPQSGDRCDSEAGAWRELGAITLGAGLGAFLGGAIVQTRKPRIESKDLPNEQQVRSVPNHNGCGDPDTLEGAVVRATLSSGGMWTGITDRSGVVRIDLAGAALGREPRAILSLESVKSGATALSLAGAPLGELELEPPTATARHAVAARASAVFLR